MMTDRFYFAIMTVRPSCESWCQRISVPLPMRPWTMPNCLRSGSAPHCIFFTFLSSRMWRERGVRKCMCRSFRGFDKRRKKKRRCASTSRSPRLNAIGSVRRPTLIVRGEQARAPAHDCWRSPRCERNPAIRRDEGAPLWRASTRAEPRCPPPHTRHMFRLKQLRGKHLLGQEILFQPDGEWRLTQNGGPPRATASHASSASGWLAARSPVGVVR
jgi:hypothetical protein